MSDELNLGSDGFFDDGDVLSVEGPGSDINAGGGNDDVLNQNDQSGMQDGGHNQLPDGSGGTSTGNQQNQMGFEGQFFNENGEVNLNDAMSFITTNMPKSYNVDDIVSPMRAPSSSFQPQTPAADAVDPIDSEMEKHFKEREDHFSTYTRYRDFLTQARDEGYEGNQLLQRADQLASQAAEKEWMRKEYRRNQESRIADEKRIKEERAHSELIPKSRTNLGVMYQRFKDGETGFNNLIYGTDIKNEKGEVVGKTKGFGVDFINYAFSMMNQGKDIPPANTVEGKEFIEKWWVQFTSNPQNLEHMMDFALSKLNLHLQQHNAAVLKKRGAAEANRLAMSAAGGKVNPKQKQPIGNQGGNHGDPFAKTLNGVDELADSV